MLQPTSSFVALMTRHASLANNNCDVHRMRCDAIEQHIFAVKCMITFHFISLLS
jgi:hypothetical protein